MLKARVAIFGAAMIGALAGVTPALAYHQPTITANASKKQRKGLFNQRIYETVSYWGQKGAGITMAQQKRAAKKARNVKRHKAAARS